LLGRTVVGSNLEGKHINTVEHALHVNEQLLAVPVIVTVSVLDGVLNTSGVTAGNEVGEASANTGAGVPEYLGGATVVHWGGPHGEDHMILVKGTIIHKGLMLVHAGLERDVVILAPATERVEEEDGVLVASLDELLTGILEEEHVTVMEGVADLEAEDSISTTLLHLGVDLAGEHSVLVEAIVKLDSFEETGALSGDEPVTLFRDGLSAGVLIGSTAEGTGNNLLFSVGEESGLVHDSKDLAGDSGALDGNSCFASKGILLSGGHVVGDGHGHKVSLAIFIGNCLHVHGLNKLELVHEALERVCPAFRDGLEVLAGVQVKINDGHGFSGGLLILSSGLNQ